LPKSHFYEDHSTLFKWFVNAKKVAWAQIPLYHYRQRKGSTDHDTDPLKKYHFFKAEQDRLNYLKQNNLMGDKRRRMEVRVVRTGVQQIKEIARLRKKDSSAMQYIDKICREIKPMLPVKVGEFGLARYYRLYVAQRHIGLYLRMVRMEKYLNSKYFLNTKVYYE
ncbi:MAG: hypothetical protein ACI39U_04995, partial [Candidatus Cryptobacteroides sp.]